MAVAILLVSMKLLSCWLCFTSQHASSSFSQVIQMCSLWTFTLPTQKTRLWTVHLCLTQGTLAPLSMVLTLLTPTWSIVTLPPPKMKRPPLPSPRTSKETPPTISLWLQTVVPDVRECVGDSEQVGIQTLVYVCTVCKKGGRHEFGCNYSIIFPQVILL